MKIKYRLDVNYYSQDYDNKCCETSIPVYTLSEGINKYLEAIEESCIDDKNKPARAHLWEYVWSDEPRKSEIISNTIAKNY